MNGVMHLLEQRLGGRYARRRKIGSQRWEQAVTFAIVRHPYDKVVSLYHYRIRIQPDGPRHEPDRAWMRRAFCGERTAARDALDSAARRILQMHFRRDFETFGYDV